MELNLHDGVASTLWKAPLASLASRKPAENSTGSFRGGHFDDRTGRERFTESTLEEDLASVLAVDVEVDWFEEQPEAVSYTDDDGRPRRHTFDLRAFLHCSARVAYAVKPVNRVEPSGIERTLQLIREQVSTRFADRYLLVTQVDLPRSLVFNARLKLHARRLHDDAAMASLAAFTSTVRGNLTIDALLTEWGPGDEGFLAAVSLIDRGLLLPVTTGRISPETRVRVSPSVH